MPCCANFVCQVLPAFWRRGYRRLHCSSAFVHKGRPLPRQGLLDVMLTVARVYFLCVRHRLPVGKLESTRRVSCEGFLSLSLSPFQLLPRLNTYHYVSHRICCAASCVLCSRSVQTRTSKRLSACQTPSSLPRTSGSASTLILRRQVKPCATVVEARTHTQ